MAGHEDRAASEVIGAVILFGFLVITFSIYQGIVVPNQNRGIEFDHNQEVQDSVQDLRNAIRQTATTGAEESVSIKLGPSYPQRVLAVNPGAGGGSLQTQSLDPITIENISATDDETADYFGPSNPTLGAFESKSVVYSPLYFQYQQAPTTHYENTLAFNQFPGGANLTITSQAVIDDRKITLIAVEGNVSEARQDSVTVDTKALSTATNTVSVTNESGPINITIGTRLTAEDWNETLEGELKANGGHVIDVKQIGERQVSILLEAGPTYDLRLAKVGVGGDTTPEVAKYIVDAEGDDTSVIENGTQKLVVEVRDRFNNPVSSVTVEAETPSAGELDNTTATTEADGQAKFVYTAPDDVDGAEDVSINVSFDGDGTDHETNVTFNVRVLDADGSGGDGGVSDVNPSGEDKLVLEASDGTTTDTAELTFNNTGDSDFDAVQIRVPFYFADSQEQADVLESFAGVGSFDGADNVSIGAPITDLDSTVTFSQGTRTVTLEFGFDSTNIKTEGDFFILVLKFDTGGTVTYFVSPQ